MRWVHGFIAVTVFALDQATKSVVEARIGLHEVHSILPGVFRLTHVKNRGAAFGIFADSPSQLKIGVLIVMSVLALGIVMALLWRQQAGARRSGIGLALILGGAVGNLFDRMMHGSVVDFLDFYLGSFHWPTFNVADTAIVVGAGLLVLDMLVAPKPALNDE